MHLTEFRVRRLGLNLTYSIATYTQHNVSESTRFRNFVLLSVSYNGMSSNIPSRQGHYLRFSQPIFCENYLFLQCVTRLISKIFRRVGKIPTSEYLVSSCLSVRMKQLGSHWRDFMKVYIVIFFENLSKNTSFVKTGQE
jgi:hypothetical protein